MKIFFYFIALAINIHFLHSSDINFTSIVANRTPPPNTQGALPYASPIGEDIGVQINGSGLSNVKYVVFELDVQFGPNPKTRLELFATPPDNSFNIVISNQQITTAGTYIVYLEDDQSNTSNSQQYIFFDIPSSNGTINIDVGNASATILGNYFIEVTNVTINNQVVTYNIRSPTELGVIFSSGNNSMVSVTNTQGVGTFRVNFPPPLTAFALATKQTKIPISGNNLSQATNVYFGSIAVPFQIISDNLIIAESPLISDIAQKLEIRVENVNGLSLVEPKPQIYILQPYLIRKLNHYFKLNKMNHIR